EPRKFHLDRKREFVDNGRGWTFGSNSRQFFGAYSWPRSNSSYSQRPSNRHRNFELRRATCHPLSRRSRVVGHFLSSPRRATPGGEKGLLKPPLLEQRRSLPRFSCASAG